MKKPFFGQYCACCTHYLTIFQALSSWFFHLSYRGGRGPAHRGRGRPPGRAGAAGRGAGGRGAGHGGAALGALVPGLNLEQTAKILIKLRPELIDSCYSYITGGKFLRAAEQAELPDNPEIEAFIRRNRV